MSTNRFHNFLTIVTIELLSNTVMLLPFGHFTQICPIVTSAPSFQSKGWGTNGTFHLQPRGAPMYHFVTKLLFFTKNMDLVPVRTKKCAEKHLKGRSKISPKISL